MIAYTALQEYWWFIISLLAGILVFLLFVQGGQTLIFTLGDNKDVRKLIINTLGRKWEVTFTTLVVFGGTAFAAFPLFYSTSFGGAYWAWMIILFSFIIQAFSYEFRSKPANFLGARTYEIFLFINGMIGPFMLGVVVATLFTGSEFTVNYHNLSDPANPVISQWGNDLHGIEALFNIWNLCWGFTVLFLSRVLGVLYIMNSVEHEQLQLKTKKSLVINTIIFLIFFLTTLSYLLLKEGISYDPQLMLPYFEKYKYFHNLMAMPVVALLMLMGVIAVLVGIFISLLKDIRKGIFFTGPGVVMVVFALFCMAGFNNTAFYPSLTDMQSSLTIRNASSSHYTLNAMAWISILIPLVIAYIVYVWYHMNKKPVNDEEINNQSHIY